MSSGEAESAAPIATTEAAANDVAQILKGIQRMQKELCSVCQEQEEPMLQIKRNARNESTFRWRENEFQYWLDAEVAWHQHR